VVKLGIYISNLFGIIFEAFIANKFFSKIGKRIESTTVFILINVVLVSFQFICNSFLLKESEFIVVSSLIFFIAFTFLYKIKMYFRLISGTLIMIISAVSEFLVAMLMSSILSVDVLSIQNNVYLFSFGILTSKFLLYLTTNLFHLNEKNFVTPISYSIKILPLLISSFLVIIVLFKCCYELYDTTYQMATLFTSIMLLIINLYFINSLERQNEYIETKNKLIETQTHLRNQIEHYEALYSHQNELRMFKHNYKNLMYSVLAFLKNNEHEKAIERLENDLNYFEKESPTINTGNPMLDAILTNKISTAMKKSIEFETIFQLSEKIRIDEFELCVLIGNSLDNAIEATEKVSEGKTIRIKILSVDNRILISITNPTIEDVDISNLQTTKKDKSNHGYGLKSIESITEKYDGQIQYSCENKLFEINIGFYNIPKL